MSYASVHSKQQMDAIFFGVVCAQLVATTIALSVFSYGILQYIRVRHHILMFVSIFAKPFAQKTVKCMECDDLNTITERWGFGGRTANNFATHECKQ